MTARRPAEVPDVDDSGSGVPSARDPRVLSIDTSVGPAEVRVFVPAQTPIGLLVLGHGAGGGLGSGWPPGIEEARDLGWVTALVEQPWRIAGRKVAPPPAQLDVAWTAVVRALRGQSADSATAATPALQRSRAPELSQLGELPFVLGDLPLVLGGRSAGARVACRTCVDLGAVAVAALSFPLHPPGRPESSRMDELRVPLLAGLPTLVVQGERDPFGTPVEFDPFRADPDLAAALTLIPVSGSHTPTRPQEVRRALLTWLSAVGASRTPASE